MAAVSAISLVDYARYLAEHPGEYQLLSASFLINVTEFFRDVEMFAALRDQVLPDLIAQGRTSGHSTFTASRATSAQPRTGSCFPTLLQEAMSG
jgi:chemotaxis methyl-accepting protein methylase